MTEPSFSIIVFFILTVILGYAVVSVFRRDYLYGVFFCFLGLLCLIALVELIKQLMIDNSILIQVDATIIAGLLILLGLTSVWGREKPKPVTIKTKTKIIFITPKQVFGTTVPFMISAIAIILDDGTSQFVKDMGIWMAVAGFVFLAIIAIIMSREKREDLDLGDDVSK